MFISRARHAAEIFSPKGPTVGLIAVEDGSPSYMLFDRVPVKPAHDSFKSKETRDTFSKWLLRFPDRVQQMKTHSILTNILILYEAVSLLGVQAIAASKVIHFPTRPLTSRPWSCNSSICFGIEGSLAVSPDQFDVQKNIFKFLLQDLSDRTGPKVIGVQYASANEVLFTLTSDLEEALANISKISMSDDSFSSLSSAIVFCDRALREEEALRPKIVLFSTGQQDIGGDPVVRADVFRSRAGGDIIVIAIGNDNREVLENIAGDTEGNIFSLSTLGHSVDFNTVTSAICNSEK